jgi:hypothetical protein
MRYVPDAGASDGTCSAYSSYNHMNNFSDFPLHPVACMRTMRGLFGAIENLCGLGIFGCDS